MGRYFLFTLPENNKKQLEIKYLEIKNEEEKVKMEQENKLQEKIMESEKNCLERGERMKREFNNFRISYLNKIDGICYAQYFDEEGNIQEWPIDGIGKVYKKPLPSPLRWQQTVQRTVNLRDLPKIGNVIQEIDPTNKVFIISSQVLWEELWYKVIFYDKEWWISSIAFWQ